MEVKAHLPRTLCNKKKDTPHVNKYDLNMELEGTHPTKPCDKKLSKHHVIYASDRNREVKEHLPRNPVIRKNTPDVNKSDLNIELEGTPHKKPYAKI